MTVVKFLLWSLFGLVSASSDEPANRIYTRRLEHNPNHSPPGGQQPSAPAPTAPTSGGGCETAFAYCGGAIGVSSTQCFKEVDTRVNRWGWVSRMSSLPVETCRFLAGAGSGTTCNTNAGTEAGSVTLNSSHFNINLNGWAIQGDEVHFYCGSTNLPMNGQQYTVAPGQYGEQYSGSSYPSWPMPSGCAPTDYFIVHATVCPTGAPTAPAPTAPAPTAPAPTAPAPTAPAPTAPAPTAPAPTAPAPSAPEPTPPVPAPTPRDFPTPPVGPPTHGGGGGGDPHFKTWLGHHYDYQGECDLVLVEAPSFESGLGLSLHVRTTIHQQEEDSKDDSYPSGHFSFIERAALRIGSETLEVAKGGKYYLNGKQQVVPAVELDERGDAVAPFFALSGFEVTYKVIKKNRRVLEMNLSPHQGNITIREYRGFLTVSIEDATADNFGDSKGLMGSFVTGEMLARDGKTVMRGDPVAFGQEWQVRTEHKLFQEARAPQFPDACIMPPASEIFMPERHMRHRRLRGVVNVAANALRKEAERACSKWEGTVKEACIMDVLTTGDIGMAEEAGAF